MREPMIYHPGTGTLIDADSAVLIDMPGLLDQDDDGEQAAADLHAAGRSRPLSLDMAVEVSAVILSGADGVETCNDEPGRADGFAVYIRNPLAFHVQDFTPATLDSDGQRVTMREAHLAAFRYAGALAEHLGGDVVTSLAAGPDSWPSRFVVEPQRDYNADDVADTGTAFGMSGDNDATQWALFRLDVDHAGQPVAGTGDLIDDYPTREAAEAGGAALDRGEALPSPVWPREPGDGERDDEDDTAAQRIVDGLVLLDSVTDAQPYDRDSGFFTDADGQRWRFTVTPEGAR